MSLETRAEAAMQTLEHAATAVQGCETAETNAAASATAAAGSATAATGSATAAATSEVNAGASATAAAGSATAAATSEVNAGASATAATGSATAAATSEVNAGASETAAAGSASAAQTAQTAAEVARDQAQAAANTQVVAYDEATIFTSGNGTWTPPAGIAGVIVTVVGGGGGTVDLDATCEGHICISSGVSGGGVTVYVDAAELSADPSYSVGAAGPRGTLSGTATHVQGGVGGDTTVHTDALTIVAKGGVGALGARVPAATSLGMVTMQPKSDTYNNGVSGYPDGNNRQSSVHTVISQQYQAFSPAIVNIHADLDDAFDAVYSSIANVDMVANFVAPEGLLPSAGSGGSGMGVRNKSAGQSIYGIGAQRGAVMFVPVY